MAPLEPLTLAWTAVNRMTSEHTLVSQDEIANFTLLKENPFKVEKMHIKDIKVVGLVHKGRLVLN